MYTYLIEPYLSCKELDNQRNFSRRSVFYLPATTKKSQNALHRLHVIFIFYLKKNHVHFIRLMLHKFIPSIQFIPMNIVVIDLSDTPNILLIYKHYGSIICHTGTNKKLWIQVCGVTLKAHHSETERGTGVSAIMNIQRLVNNKYPCPSVTSINCVTFTERRDQARQRCPRGQKEGPERPGHGTTGRCREELGRLAAVVRSSHP